MSTIKYTVKARDNAGHEFVHTFRHHLDPRMTSSNPREGLAFCQEIVEEYKGCILNAVPFRCVVCEQPAEATFYVPTAHLQGADPTLFDVPLPYCGSTACEKVCMLRAKKTASQLGQGGAGSCGCPRLEFCPHQQTDLRQLANMKLGVCVICGDSKVKMCAGCKVIPYCGRDCQKRHWHVHKAVCKQAAKRA